MRNILLSAIIMSLLISMSLSAQEEPEVPDAPEIPLYVVEPDDAQGNPEDVEPLLIPPERTDLSRIIIKLAVANYQPEARLETPFAINSQRNAIANVQTDVVNTVLQSGGSVLRSLRYEVFPYMALTVDAAGLEALQNDPNVLYIQPDAVESIMATPADATYDVINSPDAVSVGYDGRDQVVAVLDTGLRLPHVGFTDANIVEEACFSTPEASFNLASTCLNGVSELIGPGASNPQVTTVRLETQHGQHVAGTIGGNDGQTGGFRGVAPAVGLIPVNVFGVDTTNDLPQALVSDQIRALEWLYQSRDLYNIVAVNMSLGSNTTYSTLSSCVEGDQIRGELITTLKDAGIQVIAAAGNASISNGIGRPACHQDSVSIGSTTVGGTGQGAAYCNPPADTDLVSSFSNSASFLDLLAPGQCVYSSIYGDQYTYFQGTSMAAPHASGSWAILRQAYPHATGDDILAAFKDSGQSVTDTRNQLTFPRIDVWAALNRPVSTPAAVSPNNQQTGVQPTFTWESVTYANRYRLRVNQGATNVVNQIISGCESATCTYTLPSALASGDYTWTIAALNPRGAESADSVALPFTASNAPVAVADTYTTPFNTPLVVDVASGVLANDAGSGPLLALSPTMPDNGTLQFNGNGSFTYTPDVTFVGTDTFTYVASNSSGASDPATVEVVVTAPALVAPDQLEPLYPAPNSVLTDTTGNPTYVWIATDTDRYSLYLSTQDRTLLKFFDAIDAADYCENNVCSIDLTTLNPNAWLPNGDYYIQLNPEPSQQATWSEEFNFSVRSPEPPPAFTITGVTGTYTSQRATFLWDLEGSPTLAWFQVFLAETETIYDTDPDLSIAVQGWFSREEACGSFDSTDCALTLPTTTDLKTNTHYTAYVQAWGPGGINGGGIQGWLGPVTFNVGGPLPEFVETISLTPSGNRPILSWPDDPLAKSYSIFVGDVSAPSEEWIFEQNLGKDSAAINCDGTNCVYVVPEPLNSGFYYVYLQVRGTYGVARSDDPADMVGQLGWSAGPTFTLP